MPDPCSRPHHVRDPRTRASPRHSPLHGHAAAVGRSPHRSDRARNSRTRTRVARYGRDPAPFGRTAERRGERGPGSDDRDGFADCRVTGLQYRRLASRVEREEGRRAMFLLARVQAAGDVRHALIFERQLHPPGIRAAADPEEFVIHRLSCPIAVRCRRHLSGYENPGSAAARPSQGCRPPSAARAAYHRCRTAVSRYP